MAIMGSQYGANELCIASNICTGNKLLTELSNTQLRHRRIFLAFSAESFYKLINAAIKGKLAATSDEDSSASEDLLSKGTLPA